MSSIGDLIRAQRKAMFITQTELGKQVDVPHHKISYYEKGVYVPKYETMMKLNKVLDIPLSEIKNCYIKDFEEKLNKGLK